MRSAFFCLEEAIEPREGSPVRRSERDESGGGGIREEQNGAGDSPEEWSQRCGRAWIRWDTSASLAGGAGVRPMMGLPSLQALDQALVSRIWLAAEATDMRCGFDRLAQQVKVVIGADPLSGHLFVFRSRRGDRLKILVWDRDGFVLWYKRLERGVFKLPRVGEGARSVELRGSELAMILDGIDVTKLKRVPRYEGAQGSKDNREKYLG
jgi:transposase